MPNIFELNVNLNVNGKTEAEQALHETTNGGLNPTPQGGDDATSKGTSIATTAAIGSFAIQQTKQIAMEVGSYHISKIGTIYGDQARMNEIQNMTGTISTVANIASLTASGASVGALGGPIGAVIGAAVGLVTGISAEVIQMVQRNEQYNIQQRDHILNSNYTQERLGILTASKGR